MERKVTKFRNSLGITRTDVLKQIGHGLGDVVHIEANEQKGEIILRKANKVALPSGTNSEYIETLSEVMEQYSETLKSLKDR